MSPVQLELDFSPSLDTGPMTLGRALRLALETHECAPSTLRMHQWHTRWLLAPLDEGAAYFGDIPIRDIGYPQIVAFLRQERRRGIAMETIKKRLSTLRLAFHEAAAHGAIPSIPQFPRIRSDTVKGTGFWTYQEFRRAFESCEDDTLRAYITVGYWTGLRDWDINSLRWCDINFTKGTWVRRSHKNRRTVRPAELPIPPEFLQWLADRSALRWPPDRELVIGQRLEKPNKALKRLSAAAGVPRISSKGLRHSCETYLNDRGIPEDLQVHWLGLTSPRMLSTYRHVTEERLSKFPESWGTAVAA